MMLPFGLGWELFGQAASSRTYYEVMRLRQLDQWWHWLLLALVCGVVLTAVTTVYFFDSSQLARGKRWLLLLLRVFAFVGLLIFFLDLQKRTEQKLVKNSRFVFLVDTSQSMGIADEVSAAEETTGKTRISQVVHALGESELLPELQVKHDVSLYRFDETSIPTEVASFPQLPDPDDTVRAGEKDITVSANALNEIHMFWRIAGAMLGVTVLAFAMHWVLGSLVRTAEGESWALLVSVLSLIVAVVLVAVANLRHPEIDPRVAIGWASPESVARPVKLPAESEVNDDQVVPPTADAVDWAQRLEPAGASTRLGDAIAWVIQQERGSPLAGIGIMTDGNGNRGIEVALATQLARDAEIALYPIGIGSDQRPRNVRLVDLVAPARVYPGDEFKLTGYVQAYGMSGINVEVKLLSRPRDDTEAPEFLEEELVVQLGPDGAVAPIPLKITPSEVGKRIYWLRLADKNVDTDTSDNQISANVQIVDRTSRVLLLAGGPTREYRFLRNMLHRDKGVSVDVLLQTARKGVAQESDNILFDLPRDAAELYDYDCVVAFDPDWTKFDRDQLELMEQWIAEKAGGLVCVAGPIHTATWAESRRAPAHVRIVRQLYPVTFYSLNTARIQLGRFGSKTPWPLVITEDGQSVPFLALADEDEEGLDPWERFEGVYDYYPVRGVKPAAAVFARYSDPRSATDDQLPPLIVGQYYGAGRVVFLGTGEIWRMRAVDDAYFERFYTKLIRYVSEGRLLRDSNRGLLLVDKDRALRGDTITIRASVVDERFQPLRQPSISVVLQTPGPTLQMIELRRADTAREGMYTGQFIASQPGDYQLELTLPGEGEPVVLSRDIRVRLPNLELERPQRNDNVMLQLAEQTGGVYFAGLPSALEEDGTAFANRITSMRRETFLPGTPDHEFQLRLMIWLLTLICGTLFLEWLIRRLSKLA